MRRISLVLAFIVLSISVHGQTGKTSTPEERQRAVQIAQKLEANPLDPALQNDREWLLKWAADVSDLTVTMCASHGEFKKKNKYGPELTFQKLASAAAFVIQHPEQQSDKVAQELAAVNGVLNAYENIVKSDPKHRSEYWDSLLAKRSDGSLNDFVAKYVASDCSEKTKN